MRASRIASPMLPGAAWWTELSSQQHALPAHEPAHEASRLAHLTPARSFRHESSMRTSLLRLFLVLQFTACASAGVAPVAVESRPAPVRARPGSRLKPTPCTLKERVAAGDQARLSMGPGLRFGESNVEMLLHNSVGEKLQVESMSLAVDGSPIEVEAGTLDTAKVPGSYVLADLVAKQGSHEFDLKVVAHSVDRKTHTTFGLRTVLALPENVTWRVHLFVWEQGVEARMVTGCSWIEELPAPTGAPPSDEAIPVVH